MFIDCVTETNLREWTTNNGEKYQRLVKRLVCKLKCDHCGKRFIKLSNDLAPYRRNNKYKHFCGKCYNPARCADLGRDTYRKNQDKKIGETYVDSMGYVAEYIGKEYPYSDDYGGRIRQHIKVMEEHLGRKLKTSRCDSRLKGDAEVVHHIDGDKINNTLENLDVCTVTEHNKCHAMMQYIVLELFKKGQVGYNRETKRYYLLED